MGHGSRRDLLCGRGCVCTMILNASTSEKLLMTVMEDDGSRENVEGKGSASTETDGLQAIWPVSQSVTAKDSFFGELPITIPNLVHHALARG